MMSFVWGPGMASEKGRPSPIASELSRVVESDQGRSDRFTVWRELDQGLHGWQDPGAPFRSCVRQRQRRLSESMHDRRAWQPGSSSAPMK